MIPSFIAAQDVYKRQELLAQMPEYRGKTLYEVLYENGEVNKFKVPTDVPGYINDEADHFGCLLYTSKCGHF